MTIKYTGIRDNNRVGGYCEGRRFAEFTYRDEEEERFDRIVEEIRKKGFIIDASIVNWACIEVADRAEYELVAECFKELKKTIK